MSAPMAALGDALGDAVKFIFERGDSQAGPEVQVGGLGEIADLTATHMALSLLATAIAIALAVPLGLYLGHVNKAQFLAVSVSNVGRAIPAIALIGIFIAFLGVGFTNVTLALVLLAIPPILTNAYVGVRQVDRDAVDAARGMGMSDFAIIRKVELPLALPVLLGGVRLSLISVVATATIAPEASVNTLGIPIINNNVYGTGGQVGACLVVALLTLLVGALFGLLERRLVPKGLRIQSSKPSRKRRSRLVPVS